MDRLTYYGVDYGYFVTEDRCVVETVRDNTCGERVDLFSGDAINRLAAYEDTGFTPDEIEAMKGHAAQAYDDGYKDGLRDNATSVTEKIETLKAERDRFKARAAAAEEERDRFKARFKAKRDAGFSCKGCVADGMWDDDYMPCTECSRHYDDKWSDREEGAKNDA